MIANGLFCVKYNLNPAMKIEKLFAFVIFLLLSNPSHSHIHGCTDPLALNYNPEATKNNGSCEYDISTVFPVSSWDLPDIVDETSGLVIWNERIWTHNDDTDINLYAFHPDDLSVYKAYELMGTVNIDWEEISQDDEYIYVGDFGNNARGNRTDLKILRIKKNSLLLGTPLIDTISFVYSLQTDFSPAGGNNTDFDCEAFVVTSDSIFLFTKEWVSQMSSVYSLPKTPGSWEAKFRDRYNVEGLITGATFVESKNLIVLSGYSKTLLPFLFLLYDFEEVDFFGGNKRKVTINLPFHQVEGIATEDGLMYYISNETFTYSIITNKQKLHLLDLSDWLQAYINSLETGMIQEPQPELKIYPNPAEDHFYIINPDGSFGQGFGLYDLYGRLIKAGHLRSGINYVTTYGVKPGLYMLVYHNPNPGFEKIVIR
jgi:hypothetical protein